MKKILLFHNPFAAAGNNNGSLKKVITALQAGNITYELYETHESFEENRKALEIIVNRFIPTEIWLTGGDGTLHLLINSLPDSMWQLPVAIIPTGTGNDFVKNYLDNPDNGLYLAQNGTPKPVDVWQCNGRLFIHGLGIGFDGRVVESMVHNKTPFKGFLAYYYHIIKGLLVYKEKEITLAANGLEKRFPAFMVTAGNGTSFGGGFKVTPEAKINDGLLDICAISKVPVLKRPGYLKTVEKGRHLSLRYVHYFKTQALTISTTVTMPGHIDGELFYGTEFTISAYHKKLNVVM